jgi:two-component system, NarL family, response regulator LiaR
MTDERLPDKVRVLIVDDSRLTRVSLKTTLNTATDVIEMVGEAEDGSQALKMAETCKPQVVLMDIGMPIMDGIRATQAFKKSFPDVRVIMLTSHDSEQDVLDAFQSGACSYCLKETSPSMLVHVILSTAHGACWIDPQIARIVMSQLRPTAGRGLDDFGNGNNHMPNEEVDLFPPLTERERDVLRLVTQGLNNAEITERLCISLNTVKTHLKNIFQKMDVEDRTAAALKALKTRII